MARLGSQAKAGFYPTPEKVSNQLRQLLDIEEHARLLDPCCGQGKTLAALAEGSSCTTCGMELDHYRATEARSRLTRVLWTDSLVEARVSPASFGLLYLNPPYDYAMTPDSKSERLEVQFLKRYHNVLQRDGWLILVIPYTVLKFCADLLTRHFEMLQVFAFPEEEFQAFNQCVVLGRKRPLAGKDQVQEAEHSLLWLAGRYPDEFLEIVSGLEQCASPMTIPASGGPMTTFKSTRIDPLEAVPLVRKCGLLDDVLRDLTPKPCNTIRPLAPLENGHLALMLAGGYMNGEIELNGKRLVIKGVVSKTERVQSVQENGSGASTIVTRDQYVPTVKAVDMVRAELLTIR